VKILLLAVPIGAGHMKAAGAIKQAAENLSPGVDIRLEDCFRWVFPVYGWAYRHIYEFGQKHALSLLKVLYGGVGVKKGNDRLLYTFHRKSAYRFRKLLAEFKPDYILCTHFSPAYYAAVYKAAFGYRIGVVVTDYYVHPHWINCEVDDFFIPHEDLIPSMQDDGADRAKIHPFGIPVNIALEGAINEAAARKRFSLSAGRISCVVMGSRVFGGEWFEIVQEIVDFDYDLFVLCGENREAMNKIKGLKGKAHVTVLGMVDRIQELISVADILITKAGGITTTEATKAGPCLLLANSIPGLEDKNEEFFTSHNAALHVDKSNARQVIDGLLKNPKKMKSLKEDLMKVGKRDSALNIARILLKTE
jgi:processive 1,2-diacylglycerol beta-glucosyltransferase